MGPSFLILAVPSLPHPKQISCSPPPFDGHCALVCLPCPVLDTTANNSVATVCARNTSDPKQEKKRYACVFLMHSVVLAVVMAVVVVCSPLVSSFCQWWWGGMLCAVCGSACFAFSVPERCKWCLLSCISSFRRKRTYDPGFDLDCCCCCVSCSQHK